MKTCAYGVAFTLFIVYTIQVVLPAVVKGLGQKPGSTDTSVAGVLDSVNLLSERLAGQQEIVERLTKTVADGQAGARQAQDAVEKAKGVVEGHTVSVRQMVEAARTSLESANRLLDSFRVETAQLVDAKIARFEVEQQNKRDLETAAKKEFLLSGTSVGYSQMLVDYKQKQEWKRDITGKHAHMVITAEDPLQWRQRTFQGFPSYGIVKYSGYRVSLEQIAVVSLAAWRLRDTRQLQGCEWWDKDKAVGKIRGALKFLYMDEHHSRQYEVVVIHCYLEKPTSRKGGHMVATIDFERMLLYAEDVTPATEVPLVFQHKIAYCSPRLYGKLNPQRVREWFDYTRVVMNPDRYYLYDMGPVDQSLRDAIREYMDAGQVDITDFREGADFDVWTKSNGAALNDCLYRTRFTAKWVFVHDLDEFIEFVPPHTLKSTLTQHKDKAFLTHGVVWWDHQRCNKKSWEGHWGAERLVFKDPNPYCYANPGFSDPNYCLEWHGHRKYLFQPSQVYVLKIHTIWATTGDGADLHLANDLRHHHYRGLADVSTPICSLELEDTDKVEWWKRDYYMANKIVALKQCTFGKTDCVAEHPD
eukprot:jgi/Mesen1/9986/ME000072S09401